jgi:hypothetical protein
MDVHAKASKEDHGKILAFSYVDASWLHYTLHAQCEFFYKCSTIMDLNHDGIFFFYFCFENSCVEPWCASSVL